MKKPQPIAGLWLVSIRPRGLELPPKTPAKTEIPETEGPKSGPQTAISPPEADAQVLIDALDQSKTVQAPKSTMTESEMIADIWARLTQGMQAKILEMIDENTR